MKFQMKTLGEKISNQKISKEQYGRHTVSMAVLRHPRPGLPYAQAKIANRFENCQENSVKICNSTHPTETMH